MNARTLLRAVTLVYVSGLLLAPVAMVLWNAFRDGAQAALASLSTEAAIHALGLTLLVGSIAVLGNTVFGVWCGLQLVRGGLPGYVRMLINGCVDLPFVVSDVVVGVALLTLYGRGSWVGDWSGAHAISVAFAVPGMVFATIFISFPFVVREVVPVLRERGMDLEHAAATLGASSFQIFWRITLPSIRRAVAYGVALSSARALGEYGAVSVISGRIAGRTQTLTLFIDERFQSFDVVGTHAAAVVLGLLAVGTMLVIRRVASRSPEAALA